MVLGMAGKDADCDAAILGRQDSQDIGIGLPFACDENGRLPVIYLVFYFTHG